MQSEFRRGPMVLEKVTAQGLLAGSPRAEIVQEPTLRIMHALVICVMVTVKGLALPATLLSLHALAVQPASARTSTAFGIACERVLPSGCINESRRRWSMPGGEA